MIGRNTAPFGVLTLGFLMLVGTETAGHAGGFAIREQSTSAQGSSFAGSAAGFDLSSMYWNPAAVTAKDGMNSESHAAIILGRSELTAQGGSLTGLSLSTKSGNIADPALITTSYANYQFGNFYFGLSLNTPFGLTTKPNESWQGQALGRTSKLITINASPTVGYKVSPGISIAVGAQVQYIDARLSSILTGTSALGNAMGALTFEGDDVGYGFTAGILLEPSSSTKIGLGYRSMVSHKLHGDQSSGIGKSDVAVSADLPEIVTLSIRQQVTPSVTLLGSAEWTNWSRLGKLDIKCTSVGGACATTGQTLSTLEFNYDDGWFFAGGAEYAYSSDVLLRTGFAYEISPARQSTSRTVRIADNDRIWASVGATYQWSAHTTLDFAYTHVFVKDADINQQSGALSLQASADSSVDILSASLKIKW